MRVRLVTDDNTAYDLKNLGWMVDFEEMTAPQPKTNFVDIPARSGFLDLTEVDGTVYYEPMVFTLVCRRICSRSEQILQYSRQMMNLFNGKSLRVYLNEDDYYYDARVSVGNFYRDGLVLGLEIQVNAYPYRLQSNPTSESYTISGSRTITLLNDTMPVVPTISASASMIITMNDGSGTTFSISAGDNIVIPNLVIPAGGIGLTIEGTGTIGFTYTKGAF